jgi:uncharacterized membrane protein YgdD (TMEM256/DUF423 family)
MERLFFLMGGIFGGLGVVLGAFGAHTLEDRLTSDALSTYETAARYQMYHALALLAVAYAVTRWPDANLPAIAGWLFLAGIALFSGSLYLLSLTDARWLGAIAPLGGAAFIAGWLCLALAAWRG